jgi:hypothetical protein
MGLANNALLLAKIVLLQQQRALPVLVPITYTVVPVSHLALLELVFNQAHLPV